MGAVTPYSKYNRLSLGLILGIVIPLLGFLVIYFTKVYPTGILKLFTNPQLKPALPKLLSLCVILNLLLFFIFIRKNFLYSARGVLMATFIMAFFILILKIL